MSSSSDNSSYSKIPILNTLHIIYKRFKDNGYIGSKCPTCNTKRVGIYWCKNCNSEYFRKEFSKWTSESSFMDSFIQNLQLSSHNSHQFVEWIPFNQFKDIKLIAKGGYGVVSSAVWLDGPIGNTKLYHRLLGKYIVRDGPTIIALKSLNNSQNLIMKSLQELIPAIIIRSNYTTNRIIRCYGLSQNPETKDYIIVMQYADEDLHKYLIKNYINITWKDKLLALQDISWGLAFLHQAGLMHCDFHSGNLLVRSERSGRSERSWGRFHIGDLGLCRPIDHDRNQENETRIYGILPYVAPEVIRGFPYTPAADIYSFGMIMWLLATGRQPFFDRPHDLHLAFDICDGVRPEIYTGIPECYCDLMERCWDNDLLKRPSTKELCDIFIKWRFYSPEHKAIFEQAGNVSKQILNIASDPKAIYTSRLLNFPNLRQNLSTLHHKIIDVHIKEEEIKEEEEEYKTRQLELDINIDDLEYCKYY